MCQHTSLFLLFLKRGGFVVIDGDGAVVDGSDDVAGVLVVDSAANGVGGAEDLLDGTRHLAGDGAAAHNLGDLDDVLEGDVAVVGLVGVVVQGLDDEGSGGGDDRHGCLAVDDDQLDGDLHSHPVHGGLLDLLTHNLGGHTEGTNLGGQGGGSADLTAGGAHVDDLGFHVRGTAHDEKVGWIRGEGEKEGVDELVLKTRFKKKKQRTEDCPSLIPRRYSAQAALKLPERGCEHPLAWNRATVPRRSLPASMLRESESVCVCAWAACGSTFDCALHVRTSS